MCSFASERAKKIVPYVAGEQPKNKNIIKLNTNENPYPPTPKISEFLKGLDLNYLKLYPDTDFNQLREAIGKVTGIPKECIFCGNGSDEILSMAFAAFFNPNEKPIGFADITYSFYEVYAKFYEINFQLIPLQDDFTIRVDDYINRRDLQGILIANPNAPTGIGLGLDDIEKIVKSNRNIPVIIDEAYVAFSENSAESLIKNYDNLLIIRTFSKSYSLAGIRCAYAIGNPELIKTLNKIKDSINSYTVDYIAQNVAMIAVLDDEYYKNINQKVVSERQRLTSVLRECGDKVLESSSNFIFVSVKGKSGAEVYEELKKKNIIVRYFNKTRITDFVRITIGTKEQNEQLIEELNLIR